MNRWAFGRMLASVALIAVLAGSTPLRAGQQPAAAPAPGRGAGAAVPITPATEPRPRDDARHKSFLERAQAGNVDLLFVGDSITDWWLRPGPARGQAVWDEQFAPLKAANFGIAGDTTQGVLWRMRNGELEGFSSKLIVFMLGTNNINRNPPDEIAEGDRLIIEEFKKQQPQSKVLVLAIFPRGQQSDSQYRAPIKAVNEKLATFADGRQVFYLDIGEKFLGADGTLSPEIFPDGLHPNEKGYRIWADAIGGTVKDLMSTPLR